MKGEIVMLKTVIDLYIQNCYLCGVPFGLTVNYRRRLLDQGRRATFYCPNGHGQVYTVSKDDELTEAQAARQRAEEEAVRLRAANDGLLTDLAANRKELRRMRTRAKAGLCSFCHRHFVNMEKHMVTKHGTLQP